MESTTPGKALAVTAAASPAPLNVPPTTDPAVALNIAPSLVAYSFNLSKLVLSSAFPVDQSSCMYSPHSCKPSPAVVVPTPTAAFPKAPLPKFSITPPTPLLTKNFSAYTNGRIVAIEVKASPTVISLPLVSLKSSICSLSLVLATAARPM